MKRRHNWMTLAIIGHWAVAGIFTTQGQEASNTNLWRFDRMTAAWRAAQTKLGARKDTLSGGALEAFELGNRSDQVRAALVAASSGVSAPEPTQPISRLAGWTESEPSAGWWGQNVVVGFNDSGSLLQTLFGSNPSPSRSLSINGWMVSSDGGSHFTDKGILLPDPLPAGIGLVTLLGDPVIHPGGPAIFYYSSLASDVDIAGNAHADITVSKSTDGGQSFGGVSIAVQKDAAMHILDKDWMAASGSNVYVVYRHTDFSVNCNGGPQDTIELVRSTDGSATWSPPVALDTDCGDFGFFQGAQVAVGTGNNVYCAWEHFTSDQATREIRFTHSSDGGLHFSPVQAVSSVSFIGDGFLLQGHFRAFIDLQGLAVDTSGGSYNGRLYLAWHDGRNAFQPDAYTSTGYGVYRFADVLLASSSDGGNTWSAPVRVNQDAITNQADQFFPALAVDGNGRVGVTFYDRRQDPQNFLMNVFEAESTDGGATWSERQLTQHPFPSVVHQDFLVSPYYMGDYIGIASDASGTHHGFIATWGDNSSGFATVRATRVP